MYDGLGPLKAGSTRLCVPVCGNDTASSKPASVGRDAVDKRMHANDVRCVVCVCASKRCKTCSHVSEGNTFRSSVTQKSIMLSVPTSP